MEPTYLGDGVYASSNSDFPLVLTTGHHDPLFANNIIYLEPEVLRALVELIKKNFIKP